MRGNRGKVGRGRLPEIARLDSTERIFVVVYPRGKKQTHCSLIFLGKVCSAERLPARLLGLCCAPTSASFRWRPPAHAFAGKAVAAALYPLPPSAPSGQAHPSSSGNKVTAAPTQGPALRRDSGPASCWGHVDCPQTSSQMTRSSLGSRGVPFSLLGPHALDQVQTLWASPLREPQGPSSASPITVPCASLHLLP